MTFAHPPAVSRNPMIILMMACSLLLLQTSASADVYKWVNENNEVQYTQMPPPAGVKYDRVRTADHPNVSKTQHKPAAAEDAEQALKSKQQADAEAQAAYDEEVARISRQNCEIARNNLSQLTMGGHLRYRNQDGEYVTMKEEERQQRIAEAKSQIEQFCKDQTE